MNHFEKIAKKIAAEIFNTPGQIDLEYVIRTALCGVWHKISAATKASLLAEVRAELNALRFNSTTSLSLLEREEDALFLFKVS